MILKLVLSFCQNKQKILYRGTDTSGFVTEGRTSQICSDSFLTVSKPSSGHHNIIFKAKQAICVESVSKERFLSDSADIIIITIIIIIMIIRKD